LRIGRDSSAARKHGYANERQESAKKTQSRAICSFHSTIIGSGLIAVERAKSHDQWPESNCTLVIWVAVIEVAGWDIRPKRLSVTSLPAVDSVSTICSENDGSCFFITLSHARVAKLQHFYTSVTLDGNRRNAN